MRRLLDGVAMPVPHRSTEPGRPRHRRAPDALVDFHTGNCLISFSNWPLYVLSCSSDMALMSTCCWAMVLWRGGGVSQRAAALLYCLCGGGGWISGSSELGQTNDCGGFSSELRAPEKHGDRLRLLVAFRRLKVLRFRALAII